MQMAGDTRDSTEREAEKGVKRRRCCRIKNAMGVGRQTGLMDRHSDGWLGAESEIVGQTRARLMQEGREIREQIGTRQGMESAERRTNRQEANRQEDRERTV